MRAQSRGGCRHRLRWPARRAAWLLPLHLPEQPEHDRPQRLVLLAVDQQLGEGACYRVPPELADPVGSFELGEHQDVEQLGRGEPVVGRLSGQGPSFEFIWPDASLRILVIS
jgi:hypothetical protein